MKTYFYQSLRISLFTLVLFGLAYPLFIVVAATIFAPNAGRGETISINNKIVGFELIGQSFTSDRYFQSRPSAVNYNAAATGGSNKGPSNPDYLKTVEERVNKILSENPGVRKEDIPVDLITASGGGLDPHISIEAATIQISRIAKVRGLNADKLAQLVRENSEAPVLGVGPSRVHVLRLNLALDALK